MRALSGRQAARCEASKSPPHVCRCRCHGARHGAAYWGGADPSGDQGTERAQPLPEFARLYEQGKTEPHWQAQTRGLIVA